MTGKGSTPVGNAWPELKPWRRYPATPDETQSIRESLPLAAFRAGLEQDANLDAGLIRAAVDALSNEPADVELAATSVRIPANLRNLAQEIVNHRWASSVSDLLVRGLRQQLVALTTDAINTDQSQEIREALNEYYASRPDERTDLTELAIAAAEIDGHPAAAHPNLVAMAVEDLADDAFVEDVLAWVQGALAFTTDPARA